MKVKCLPHRHTTGARMNTCVPYSVSFAASDQVDAELNEVLGWRKRLFLVAGTEHTVTVH